MALAANELAPTRWSLIERLKNWDDQQSWRDFFDTYWRLIYGAAARSGLTPTEAEEVVQETIITVCKSIEKFRADPAAGAFKNWLLTIVRWRVADQFRKRPREEKERWHRPGNISGGVTESTATEERVPDPQAHAIEQAWEQEWQSHLINAALEKLKPQVNAKHFQVFYLHVIKQQEPAKIAKALGLEVNQIYVIKNRLSGLFKKAVFEIENAAHRTAKAAAS